jgi:hypothetical protein
LRRGRPFGEPGVGTSVFSRNDTPARLLTQLELARRWAVSIRTLERWRWQKRGPSYLKIMGRILYREDDIVAFELASRREFNTARKLSAGKRQTAPHGTPTTSQSHVTTSEANEPDDHA